MCVSYAKSIPENDEFQKYKKTQRQHQNKFHIPGLAKGWAVLVAIVTDRPTHSREQKSYSEDITTIYRAHRSMTALTTPRW
jgi:hypothetical protein